MDERDYPDLLVEMLEAATHQILYLREIYPENVFSKRRKYGIPVVMAEHAGVAAYVADHLTSVRDLLSNPRKREGLDRFEVLIHRGEAFVEKYVFEFGRIDIEGGRMASRHRFAYSAAAAPRVGEELELKFRSLLLRLNEKLTTGMRRMRESGELTFSFRIKSSMSAAMAITAEEDAWCAVDDDEEEGGDEAVMLVARSQSRRTMVPIYAMKHPVAINVFAMKE